MLCRSRDDKVSIILVNQNFVSGPSYIDVFFCISCILYVLNGWNFLDGDSRRASDFIGLDSNFNWFTFGDLSCVLQVFVTLSLNRAFMS